MSELAEDLRVAARALRGTSWPLEMAQRMEERAARLDKAAGWVGAAAAVHKRTLGGWHPVLHTQFTAPFWLSDGGDREAMTADEVAWLAPTRTEPAP